ncbi:MAG: hypothetical protein R3B07_32560 [Polyangiaceae bacterium]
MGTRLGVLGAILALTFTSGSAAAQSADASGTAPAAVPTAAPPDGHVVADDRIVEGSAGLKLLLGGSLWSTPDNIPGGYEGIGFAGSAGGFAYGGAVYAEGRFFKYLGLELDVGYDDTTLKRKVTFRGVVAGQAVSADVHESVETSSMFFGLLIKGVVPAPFGRAWFGLGPQFKSAGSADGKLDGASFADGLIKAKAESSTLLNLGLGMVIHAGDLIEIPIELRAAKNLSQEADWDKRVKLNTSGNTLTSYEVTAQSSWDFRLGLGVGARF